MSLRTRPAVYVLKPCARRAEVTTNIECESVPVMRVLTSASYANALHGCARSLPKIGR